MKIRFIDYPLMDRLAEIRDKLDGAKREVLLPEHTWILRRVHSKEEGHSIPLSAAQIAIRTIKDTNSITLDNPFIRALLMVLSLPGAPQAKQLLRFVVHDEEIMNEIIELEKSNRKDWDLDNFVWQLVQGLQIGWADIPVDQDTPVHRLELKTGGTILSSLIQIETVRSWGYL